MSAYLNTRLMDDVGDLMRETAERDILPLFRDNGRIDVTEKSAGEVVTQADRNAERRISAALTRCCQARS